MIDKVMSYMPESFVYVLAFFGFFVVYPYAVCAAIGEVLYQAYERNCLRGFK